MGLLYDSWGTYAARKVIKGVNRKVRRYESLPYVEKQPPLLSVLRESWKQGKEEASAKHLAKLVEKHKTGGTA